MIKLIADSGSTKTEWLLMDNKQVIGKAITEGMNPYIFPQEKLNEIIQTHLPDNFKQNVSQLFFYGAGCLLEEGNAIIRSVLKNNFQGTELFVESDLLAAARACFKNEKGITVISGTGSAVCYYNGKTIEEISPSLGFVLGDEGSGNHIGRKLVTDYFYHKMPENLSEEFANKYGITMEKTIQSIYKSDAPNRYLASFSTFAADHIEEKYCRQLVKSCFNELFEMHILPMHRIHPVSLGFNGSIAFIYRELLEEIAGENKINITRVIKSPMDELINFHTK